MKLNPCHLLPVLALSLGLSTAQAALGITHQYDAEGIAGFDLFAGGVYWWNGPGRCSGEQPNQATLKLRPTLLGNAWTNSRSCAIRPGPEDQPVRDDAYFYFFSGGQLQRKAVNAGVAAPPIAMNTAPLTPTLGNNLGGAVLELYQGNLYFSRYNGGVADIYRYPSDGSQPPQYDSTLIGGGQVRKIKHFQYQDAINGPTLAFVALLDNGRLYRRKYNPSGTTTLLAQGVADFAVQSRTFAFGGQTITDIFAARGTFNPSPTSGPGSLVKINADTGVSTVAYTAPGDNQVLSVATDSDEYVTFDGEVSRIYIAESAVICGDLLCGTTDTFIRRNTIPGTDGSWDLIVPTGGGLGLRSDDERLWFIRTNAVKYVAAGSAPVELDIVADQLEAVQITQRPTNGVPLVAYRDFTYVRGFAHLRTNSTGIDTWFPSARLQVWINGVEIPGSPFQNVNSVGFTTNANLWDLRTNAALPCFLFQLPRLAPGSLTMTMTVNPDQAIVETGPTPYGNNSVSLPAPITVAERGLPCLVMLPVSTPWGTYNESTPGFWDILGRCRSLLPVEGLWYYGNYSAHGNLLTDTMYNAGLDDESASDLLDVVECVAEQTADPGGCPDTHWIGMVHPGSTNFNGLGYVPGRSLLVRMATAANRQPWNLPFGGRTMAHELGHNFGRNHVNCGGPENPDLNYPYQPCDFGTGGPNGWIGFDPLTLTPIDATAFGDLMSYGTNRWVSDYTYSAIFNSPKNTKSSGGGGGFIAPRGVGATPMLLVQGRVFPGEGRGVFQTFYQYPAGTADAGRVAASAARAAEAAGEANPFRLVMFTAAGQVLDSTPVLVSHGEDDGDDSPRFIQYVPLPDNTRRVALMQGNQVFVERIISPHAPNLQLGPVTLNPATGFLAVRWSASDPDGDRLVFGVQYSADNGATWQALLINYPWLSASLDTSRLRGGPQARIRVLASDGANTAIAVSPPFTVPNHPPQPAVNGVDEGERVPFGTARRVEGIGFDVEDGSQGTQMSWNLAGPTAFSSTEPTFALRDLSPGSYVASLTAIDSQGTSGTTERRFSIEPLQVPTAAVAPVLDGTADPAYRQAAFVRVPLGGGRFASARLVHSGGALYVSFSDLQPPTPGQRRIIGLRVDADASGGRFGQPGDRGFFVDDSGIPFQEVGDGSGMVETLTPAAGFSSRVSRTATGWTAEFRIADNLVGGWDHAVRLMIDHGTPGWPVTADEDSPASWAPAWLGDQPPVPANRAPVARAGSPQNYSAGQPRTVILDGSESYDPDGQALTFQWSQVGGPAVVLQGASGVNPRFQTAGYTNPVTLTFRLVVSDGTTASAPADTTVTLTPTTRPPAPPQLVQGQLNDGVFQVSYNGEPGRAYVLQGTTNFVHWSNLRTNTADYQGRVDFLDTDSAKHRYRFYRTMQP